MNVGSGLVNVLQNVTAVVSLSGYEVEKWSRCRLRVQWQRKEGAGRLLLSCEVCPPLCGPLGVLAFQTLCNVK